MILRPFNALFFTVAALFALILIIGTLLLRDRSERTRRGAIIIASLLTMVGFFVYKVYLSRDAEYARLTAGMGGFNWWGELPLQLCNINMILIPIAVHWEKRPLMGFCFFVGVLGAAMAVAMPGTGFSGYSLLLPRMLGYYGTHFAIIIEALALATLGLYKPRLRDLPMCAVTLLLIAFAIFCVNMLLRWTGVHPKANYFYTVETEGNAILEFFYKRIPIPFLYSVPCLLILTAYMVVLMGVINGVKWVMGRGGIRH